MVSLAVYWPVPPGTSWTVSVPVKGLPSRPLNFQALAGGDEEVAAAFTPVHFPRVAGDPVEPVHESDGAAPRRRLW